MDREILPIFRLVFKETTLVSHTEEIEMNRASELFESSGNDFVVYVLKTID